MKKDREMERGPRGPQGLPNPKLSDSVSPHETREHHVKINKLLTFYHAGHTRIPDRNTIRLGLTPGFTQAKAQKNVTEVYVMIAQDAQSCEGSGA